MTRPRLYADNAATSFPKPPAVARAMNDYAQSIGASAGRGAYAEALDAGQILSTCRRRLARLIHAESPEQVVFTFNCTGALNQALKGWLRHGDHVVATAMEHNSVLRPLNRLAADGDISVQYVAADPQTGLVDPDDLFAAVTATTRLIAVNHGSNVTGTLQPIEAIGPHARKLEIPLLVDAAQTAGHVPIDVQTLCIDFLAVPGHKGLMGPLGTGALYIRPGLEGDLRPILEGGTGSVSDLPVQPDFMPDRYESGSHNAIGLAGLSAALEWVLDESVEALRAHEVAMCEAFLTQARDVPGLHVYGPREAARRSAVFSVRLADMEPAELSALLEVEFGILTRSGLHCAPLAHRTIGTDRTGGTTRISLGGLNTTDDAVRCADALLKLAAADAPA